MTQTDLRTKKWGRWLFFLAFLTLVILAGSDIYQVSGHGVFLGHFDKIWGAIFVGYFVISVVFLLGILGAIWLPEKITRLIGPLLRIRAYWWLKWPLTLVTVLWPAWILLYTDFGFDFSLFVIRFYCFVIAVILGGCLLTNERHKIVSWLGIIQSVILFGAVFLIAKSLVAVTDFPLSLDWSEGNRIWDYSARFGRELYIYPDGWQIDAYIDRGRQALWGLPFLLPNVTITQIRLWSVIVFTIPYAIFGWILFRMPTIKSRTWIWAGLWVMLFLNQGPIYTPLVLSAILVALPRRWPVWLGLPLVFMAGYYAQLSRLTWMFAPAIWAMMVAINDRDLEISRKKVKDWGIVIAYGLAGFWGGFGVSGWRRMRAYLRQVSSNVTPTDLPVTTPVVSEAVESVSQVAGSTTITDQALLWSRLFPNPTYREGILLGLVLAIGPLLIFLTYLLVSKRWSLSRWQKLGLSLPLLAFMLIGIVISVKIGGGSNLHNLDMLLIALVFVAAFAWEHGGHKTILETKDASLWLQVVILLMVAIPAFYPVIDAYPLDLPPKDRVDRTLKIIQRESDKAVAAGQEVLFMDQRQLLTFHYIENVPLVVDYEKKKVMDRAMSGDSEYFEDFYLDLANHRFALIIVEPQRIRHATPEEDWSEENDIWVERVTKPLLCYYEPIHEMKKTSVWILAPKEQPGDCSYP